ncbi:pyrroline-5-carboxylate reductase [Catenovulum sp. SM1970]|uniref:pyrroline-5-carboxylate reductase n=1 Tax=Marinifaba aquimaris TaxID=2741323 RepID=UPI001571B154|nr:pyrroline-5-carboxylate reductase [Marinifaba aquimaris]NTS78084.1 pyrroline-5-carboxylate reductase [Marinifaba aquimaris]
MNNRKIAFIGAGNMTRSIIGGLIKNGYDAKAIFAANPSLPKLDALKSDFGIETSQSNQEVAKQADVIVLAVKPQMMADMLAKLIESGIDLSSKLFISIAAGILVDRLQNMLGGENNTFKIIRTMPNTPSLLGLGLTGLYAPSNIAQQDKDFANDMMNAVGKSIWVQDEAGIDKIIAVAGSAPAYFFLFMESIEQEAINLGFSQEDARAIVQQVALGSAQMVCQNPELAISQLRENVTSKGGTTAEAIRTYEESELRQISQKAMQAAIARAEEMAKLI